MAGLTPSRGGAYPGWTPNPDSDVVRMMTELYRELHQEEPLVLACHAGLECGILGSRYPGLDMVSFGPTILGAHSPDERASVSSTAKYWNWFKEALVAPRIARMNVSNNQGKRPKHCRHQRRRHHRQGHPELLAEAMTEFGDVYVVAPDSPQSGMGHAVTFSRILRLHPFEFGRGPSNRAPARALPVDCVKLAVAEVFGEDNLPDLLVSGINHGSNASINVIYSGTMSAAVEGAMCGIPSIGFSLLDERWDADFTASVNVARTMAQAVLENGLPQGTCLNVNIPRVSLPPT